jgi:hypothetical protein
MSPYVMNQEDVGLDDDEWALPEGMQPLLEHLPVYTENTASGIALLWAPAPFNQRTGYTRRAIDVPLVNCWFMVSAYISIFNQCVDSVSRLSCAHAEP